jgi:hypothetical protein
MICILFIPLLKCNDQPLYLSDGNKLDLSREIKIGKIVQREQENHDSYKHISNIADQDHHLILEEMNGQEDCCKSN